MIALDITLFFNMEAPVAVSAVYVSGNKAFLMCEVGEYKCFKVDLKAGKVFGADNVKKEIKVDKILSPKRSSLLGVLMDGGIVNALLIWTHSVPWNTKDACNQITKQMNEQFNRYGISTMLEEHQWIFMYNGSPISLEDVINLIPVDAEMI